MASILIVVWGKYEFQADFSSIDRQDKNGNDNFNAMHLFTTFSVSIHQPMCL